MASISNAPVRHRTVGIDLAISAVQVAQIFDDGRAIGKPIRFRLTSTDLRRFVSAIKSGVGADTPITAVMEPTGMAWHGFRWPTGCSVPESKSFGSRVSA
ncbi:hypothetical protein BA763_24060 [Burkholderia cenocepacia]|nr:hypothetical protein BA763_24060 [Burkholderia cenocepacia]